MQRSFQAQFLTGVVLTILYVALYEISDAMVDTLHFAGIASIFFLPAFIRLLGYLLIGMWVIPVLAIAGSWLVFTGSYEIAPGHQAELVMAAFTAVGGPLGVALVSRLSGLKPSLDNLTPLRLLALSFACSAGNSAFHHASLQFIGHEATSLSATAIILVGDMIGMWTILYALKALLSLYRFFRG